MHDSMNKSFLFTTSDSSKLSQQKLSKSIHFYGRIIVSDSFMIKIKENNQIRAQQNMFYCKHWTICESDPSNNNNAHAYEVHEH